jgi:FkbM family methyltransferase
MLAFEDDHATRQILAFGAHTRNEVALLTSFVDPGDLIYDVGAHIGTFAIPLANAAGPAGRLIAIEADPDNFALLRRNLDRQGLGDRALAVYGIAGGQDVLHRAQRTAGHTSATWFTPDPAGEAVTTIQLDDLHLSLGTRQPVAVIKIDVEGMELAVLRSAQQMLARDRPILYIEIALEQMARYGVACGDIEAFLRPLRYRFFRNFGDRNSSHDGFQLAELSGLAEGGPFYDLLAIPAGSPRLERAVSCFGR